MAVQTANLASLNAQLSVSVDVATLPSVGSVGVQISGNFTGTISFFGSIDGSNLFAVAAVPITAAGGAAVASTTSGGQWAITVNGFNLVIIKMSSYSAGTAVVSTDVTVAPVGVPAFLSALSQGDNNGGPPLASGLPSLSLFGSDNDKNFQGSDNAQIICTAVAGQAFITFLDNPWIQGLTIGQAILLSAAPNSAAIEEVIVGTNNTPSTGTGTFVVNLLNAVVNNGSNYGTFDVFGVDGPTTIGINSSAPGLSVPGQTVTGVKGALQLLYNPSASDSKRPIVPTIMSKGNPGVMAVQNVPDAVGANDLTFIRQLLEKLVTLQSLNNFLLAQLKDGGTMEVPAGIFPESNGQIN